MPPAGKGRKVIKCDPSRSPALVGAPSGIVPFTLSRANTNCYVILRPPGGRATVGCVNGRPVNAGTRRACLLLAVAGTLVLMAGVLLGVVTAVLGLFEPGRWVLPSTIAGGLIAAGLFCGVMLVAVTEPASRRGGTLTAPGAPVPASHRRFDDTVRPPSPAVLGGRPPATQDRDPVADYQVRQTRTGIEADIVAAGGVSSEALRWRLAEALAQSGLGQPDVTVRVTGDLARNPGSDKLRRFVPLPEMACR
jgi:hypothetical protein